MGGGYHRYWWTLGRKYSMDHEKLKLGVSTIGTIPDRAAHAIRKAGHDLEALTALEEHIPANWPPFKRFKIYLSLRLGYSIGSQAYGRLSH